MIQLKLYTVDKLSSPIFCCLWVCRASVFTRPYLHFFFSNIYTGMLRRKWPKVVSNVFLVPFAIFLMFWNSSCSFTSDTWPGGLWAFLNGRQWFLRKWGVWAPGNFLSQKSLANTSTIYKIVYIKKIHLMTFCIFFLSPRRLPLQPRKVLLILQWYNI